MNIGILGRAGSLEDQLAHATGAEADGFASWALPQIMAEDALTTLAVAGTRTDRITLGTAVVPVYGRHPANLAMQATTVNAATGGRLLLGIGLSHQVMIEGVFGISFDKPVGYLSEYLDILLPAMAGEVVDVEGDRNSFHGATQPVAAAPPVVVAALGPQMLRLAGQRTDGTITWMTGRRTLGDHTVPTITQAAAEAGRPAPRIIVGLPVCVTDDVDGARARANELFAIYGELPSYRAMLDREGAESPGDVAIIGAEESVVDQIQALAGEGVTDFGASEFATNADEAARTRQALRSLL
ncbi:MAG: TIGR03564 family F420-dependent LLM class oxidoreductase [Acidimicrobiia bacterium]